MNKNKQKYPKNKKLRLGGKINKTIAQGPLRDGSGFNQSLPVSKLQTLNHQTPASAKALFHTVIDGEVS